jgi:selenide, water dikinase
VWKLDDTRGLVVTTDFFTPIVDDPFDYGQISAANSLSDIYAMGGTPFMALNITALPPQLPTEIGAEILRGGAEKAKEAGVVIAGGHTIQDKEPKYGLVALGFVPLDHILTKGGLKAGDVLFLSKPIGSGVISSGIKNGKAKPEEAAKAIKWMKKLNKDASSLAVRHGARGATDVTGFSLLGHAWEMAAASKVGMKFEYDQVALYSGTERLAKEWCFAGGAYNNMEFYGPQVEFVKDFPKEKQLILFDPQTSGGLLFGIPAERAQVCIKDAREQNIPLWKVGEVTRSGKIEMI